MCVSADLCGSSYIYKLFPTVGELVCRREKSHRRTKIRRHSFVKHYMNPLKWYACKRQSHNLLRKDCCLHLSTKETLMKEVAISSKTSIPIHRTTLSHIPEDRSFKNSSTSLSNLLKPTGYAMQFNNQQLYALPTLYLCVLYLSENKQRLVPLTT